MIMKPFVFVNCPTKMTNCQYFQFDIPIKVNPIRSQTNDCTACRAFSLYAAAPCSIPVIP